MDIIDEDVSLFIKSLLNQEDSISRVETVVKMAMKHCKSQVTQNLGVDLKDLKDHTQIPDRAVHFA